jgi:hypothetical protein
VSTWYEGGGGGGGLTRARRQFIPCPQGLNPETFRFWEALEAGAIPVRVQPARPPARARIAEYVCCVDGRRRSSDL